MRSNLFLNSAQRFGDFALLLLRMFVGLFLIWGVWDNITSAERMREFAEFLAKHRFAQPALLAQLSAWAQLAVGMAFITGLLTRWAGIICVVNFLVAIVMVDRLGGMRGVFPSGCLVVVGLYLATYGAGRFSLDEVVGANDAPTRSSGVRLRK